jgi:hypothetical protein
MPLLAKLSQERKPQLIQMTYVPFLAPGQKTSLKKGLPLVDGRS